MPRPLYDALVVGDAIVDIVTPPLPPGVPGDRQSRVAGFSNLPGGNATNFALTFAALGHRTRFVGCIGRDWAGRVLGEAYRRGQVDARLRVSPTKATGMTMAVTFDDSTRHLITAAGANEDLRLADVPASWIASTQHLHRAGYWWASGLIGAPTATLLAKARRAGVATSLDVATDPEGWPPDRRDAVLSVLPDVTTFFGNEDEVRRLAGAPSLERAAEALLAEGVQEVVVHQGGHGSTAFTRGGVWSAGAFPVVPSNPTGSGDVFNAAYVHASAVGVDPMARLRFANASAACHLEDLKGPYPTRQRIRARFGVSL